MKLSLSLLVSIFSLFVALLGAQSNDLDFTFSGSESVRNIENNLFYQMAPFRASVLEISGLSFSEQRLSFSQKSRHSSLNMGLSFDRNLLKHTINSGFDYLYDSSNLEEDFQPYRNKTGFLGYTLDILPSDSLLFEAGIKGYMRSEEDRYLVGNTLNSDGYQTFGRISAGTEVWSTKAGLSADFDLKKLNWESYHTAALNAYLNHHSDSFMFNNQFNVSQRKDDLYVLGPDETEKNRGHYALYDRQKSNSLLYSGSVSFYPLDALKITAQESYSHRSISLDDNIVRNNADYINQASLNLTVAPLSSLIWKIDINHSYAIKDFNYTRNTRHTESRNLSTILGWEYLPGDTLSTGASIDLQRTSYPDDSHRWDNDLRNIRCNLGNVHYWRDRLKLSNHLYLSQTDDVYINGILSNNNKLTRSIIYSPECAVLIGDRLLFNQLYSIRADYTDYVYEAENKGLYRQMSLDYDLIFDSFPLIARSADQRWMLLPYRNNNETAIMADISFAYERNEYADYVIDHYSIDFKNTRYTAALTLKHDIRDVYYKIQPQFTWGTWQEYNLLVGFAWKFTYNSLLELSVNPVGEHLNDLDWRTSVSLSAHF